MPGLGGICGVKMSNLLQKCALFWHICKACHHRWIPSSWSKGVEFGQEVLKPHQDSQVGTAVWEIIGKQAVGEDPVWYDVVSVGDYGKLFCTLGRLLKNPEVSQTVEVDWYQHGLCFRVGPHLSVGNKTLLSLLLIKSKVTCAFGYCLQTNKAYLKISSPYTKTLWWLQNCSRPLSWRNANLDLLHWPRHQWFRMACGWQFDACQLWQSSHLEKSRLLLGMVFWKHAVFEIGDLPAKTALWAMTLCIPIPCLAVVPRALYPPPDRKPPTPTVTHCPWM